MAHPRTVRFWTYWNGTYTRMLLEHDRPIMMESGGPDDEGWHRERCMYRYDADAGVVYCESMSEGRDCDGYTSHRAEHQCAVADLASYMPPADYCDEHTRPTPLWQRVSAEQRDEYAEMMGY